METDEADGGFVLEVTRFAPMLATDSLRCASFAELDSAINRTNDEPEVVLGLLCDEGAGGAFFLFVHGGRAWVHLSAGHCRTAHSLTAPESAEPVVFRLDNGDLRAVPADRTLTREEGLLALRHWFATEQLWLELEWVCA